MLRRCLICSSVIPLRPGRGLQKTYCSDCAATRKKNTSLRWAKQNKARTVEISRKAGLRYREAHPERIKAKAIRSNITQKMKLLRIIGITCSNPECATPYLPVEIDHIQPTGYWSGKEHRRRVRNATSNDLLRLHRNGVDINKIVQPLCRVCHVEKTRRDRINKITSDTPEVF